MDWRNVSRSRSRMGMDMEWRPGSRSRSRPPAPGSSNLNPWDHASEAHSHSLLLQDSDSLGNSFTMNGLDSNGFDGAMDIKNSRSPIPIRKSSAGGLPMPSLTAATAAPPVVSTSSSFLDNLPSFQFTGPENRMRAHTTSMMPPPTSLNNFGFHPSSVPVSGLYGAPVLGGDGPSAVAPFGSPFEQRHAYPKHVRKTSFDHTVSRVGILSDVGGRHQVNGRPVPPESSLVSLIAGWGGVVTWFTDAVWALVCRARDAQMWRLMRSHIFAAISGSRKRSSMNPRLRLPVRLPMACRRARSPSPIRLRMPSTITST